MFCFIMNLTDIVGRKMLLTWSYTEKSVDLLVQGQRAAE